MIERLRNFVTSDWKKPPWAAKLETTAAAITVLGLAVTGISYASKWLTGAVPVLLASLMRDVTVPIATLFVLPALAMMIAAYVIRRRYIRSLRRTVDPLIPRASSPNSVLGSDIIAVTRAPHLITAAEPGTAFTMATAIVEGTKGTIALWVFVDSPERGIRDLSNHRYLFAHAGHDGRKMPISGGRAYTNVLALSLSPVDKSARQRNWRLWISSSSGDGLTLTLPDSLSAPNWHHFAVRWDHERPILELVIDGVPAKASTTYRDRWPNPQGQLTVGTWPTRTPIHFIESEVMRVVAVDRFVADEELHREVNEIQESLRRESR